MTRPLSPLLPLGMIAIMLPQAQAATKTVHVPDEFVGTWSIDALTVTGPCLHSMHYVLRAQPGDAVQTNENIDVDGAVSRSGGVAVTIGKGSVKVPITGNLDPNGTGTGTWQSIGSSSSECTGSWSAKRQP